MRGLLREVVYVGQKEDGTPEILDRPQDQAYRDTIPDELRADAEDRGREIDKRAELDPQFQRDRQKFKGKRTFGIEKSDNLKKQYEKQLEKYKEIQEAQKVYMYEVRSSFVGSVGYHKPTATLVVRFKPPRSIQYQEAVYFYYRVPPSIYEQLKRTTSVGGGLHNRVFKNYKYDLVQRGQSLWKPSYRRDRARRTARNR